MSRSHYGNGLTLLELVVALGILAVLSTIAVGSLDPLADQARYEATLRLLDDLHEATFGRWGTRQNNGQPIISGYLADTGSLPSDLDSLLNMPVGLVAYSNQSFDSDRDGTDDVTLASGWRGPYFQLGVGQTDIVDGWGHSPLVDPDGGDFDFTSLGSDDDSIAPEDGYREDITAEIADVRYTADVTFRLFEIDGTTSTRIDPTPTGTEQLAVIFYGINANGGTTGAIEEVTLPVAASGTFEADRTGLMHGNYAARAVLWADVDSDDIFDSGESLSLASYVHYFTVTGGADLRLEMELR